MFDVTGKELNEGDKIVLIPQNGYTMALSMGIIVGFTSKKVKIRLTTKCWSYSNDECLKFPDQVARVL